MALAPCLIGYGAIAKRLYADSNTKREGNIYWKWICNYVADDYVEAVRVGRGSVPSCRFYTKLTIFSHSRKKCGATVTKSNRRAD
jgi:thiaminase